MNTKIFLLAAGSALVMTSCNPDAAPNFSASSNEVMVGQPVTFTDASEDSYDRVWDFGDGYTSEDQNARVVSHMYSDTGVYTVTLQVWDKKEKNSVVAEQVITVTTDNDVFESFQEANYEAWKTMVMEMVGVWDLETYIYTPSGCGFDSDSKAFSKSYYEFVDENTVLYNDELDNLSSGTWSIIDADNMMVLGQHFEIDSRSSSSMKISQFSAYEWNNGTNDVICSESEVWTLKK